MKRTIATLIAGVFATAAFAQTPAPAAAQTTAPDSATPPAVAKAEAAHDKQDTKEGRKHVGVVKRHKKAEATDAKKDAAKDAKQDAAADTTAPAPTK
jgi:hypothetical protein